MKENNSNRNRHKAEYNSRGMMRRLTVASGFALCVVAFLAGGLAVLGVSGKYNLKQQTMSYAADAGKSVQAVTATAGEGKAREEGQVIYQEKRYRYNEDILTFLFMGIDRESGERNPDAYAGGGQADALSCLCSTPIRRP